jgi:hypothetical protein
MENHLFDAYERSCSIIEKHKLQRRRHHKARGRKAMLALFEGLESRAYLAAVSWVGGTGDWNVAGNWSGGVLPSSSDDVTISASGNVTVAGTMPVHTLTNSGIVNFVGSADHGYIAMTNQGTVINSGTSNLYMYSVVNDTAGVIDLKTDAGLNGYNFTNKGLIRKSAGTGTSVLSGYLTNSGGGFDIETGTLSFQESNVGLTAGPIHIATGCVLDFHVSGGVYLQGTLASTGAGTVTVSSGYFYGPSTSYGQDADATGTLNFAPDTLYFTGGYISGVASNRLINTGEVNFIGNTDRTSQYIVLLNQGTVINSGSSGLYMYTVINDTAGVIDLKTDAGINGYNFTNKGLIRKSAGTGTSVL